MAHFTCNVFIRLHTEADSMEEAKAKLLAAAEQRYGKREVGYFAKHSAKPEGEVPIDTI